MNANAVEPFITWYWDGRDNREVVVVWLQVVYFAATFPYMILLTLLVTGLCQDGALSGVLYFITPTWEKLLDIKVTTIIRFNKSIIHSVHILSFSF